MYYGNKFMYVGGDDEIRCDKCGSDDLEETDIQDDPDATNYFCNNCHEEYCFFHDDGFEEMFYEWI